MGLNFHSVDILFDEDNVCDVRKSINAIASDFMKQYLKARSDNLFMRDFGDYIGMLAETFLNDEPGLLQQLRREYKEISMLNSMKR